MEEQQPSGSPPDRQNTLPPTSGTGFWVSYDIGIWTRLRTLVESAGRLLHIMSPSTKQNEFLEFTNLDKGIGSKDIDSFYTFLQNIYMRLETQKIDRERWRVTRVSTYKDNNNGAKHEYLLATMKYNELEIYMRIERRVQKPAVGNLVGSSGSQTPAPAVTSDGSDPSPEDDSSSNAPTPRKNSWSKIASDEVTYSKDLKKLCISSDIEVDVIDFKDSKIPLPHLAILVLCVNEVASEYHFLTQNCYWFAQVTAEALKILDPDHTVSSPRSAGKRGTWNSFPVHLFFKDPKEMATTVVKAYRVRWDKFVTEIEDTINNPDSQPVQEERRKRLEVQKRLEEANSHGAEMEEEIKRLKAQLATTPAGL